MKKHCVSISPIRSHQPEQKPEWIKNSRLEVGPEGHSTEDIWIPEWNGEIFVQLIIKELLHAKVERNEIRAGQPVPPDYYIFKKI